MHLRVVVWPSEKFGIWEALRQFVNCCGPCHPSGATHKMGYGVFGIDGPKKVKKFDIKVQIRALSRNAYYVYRSKPNVMVFVYVLGEVKDFRIN